MKKVVPRPFYILAFSLLGVVVCLTLLPVFWAQARVIYEPASLTVVFALLSLAIAMILFGLLGDSTALVKAQAPHGFAIQIAGSAGGFVVFFYLLSSGLSPYSTLVVYLYKGSTALLQQGDGQVEVTLAGKIRRSDYSSNGQVTFSFLPKTEDRRVLVSGSQWAIKSIEPINCVTPEGLVVSTCDKIDVQLAQAQRCLASAQLVVQESAPVDTTLETVLSNLRDDLQRTMPTSPVTLRFSDKLLADGLQKKKFSVNRRDGSPKNACGHLNLLVESFNRSLSKNALVISTSCTGILVSESGETLAKEYKSCLQ